MEIHPQRGMEPETAAPARANADFSEQVLDSKRDFPAHLVIVLSL
jgi:hypothetical protein